MKPVKAAEHDAYISKIKKRAAQPSKATSKPLKKTLPKPPLKSYRPQADKESESEYDIFADETDEDEGAQHGESALEYYMSDEC